MRQMKKKVIIAVLVTLILVAAVAFAIGYFVVNGKNKEIADLNTKIADTRCLAFSEDLRADSIITPGDVREIDFKLASTSSGMYFYKKTGEIVNGVEQERLYHYVTYIDENGEKQESYTPATTGELFGRVVKGNVSANTPILDSLLYAEGEDPTIDERLEEFNFLQLPSDLVENDYMDVRIQFPDGEDYSVLVGKKVEKLAGMNSLFVKMNEEEIMAMSSAIIEAYMQDGVRFYANKYTDPATQLIDERIEDYVAKYEYAVEKLRNELKKLEARKELATMLAEDGTYNLTVLDENGEATMQPVVLETEVVDNETYVTEEAFALLPEATVEQLLAEIEEAEEADLDVNKLAEYAGIKTEHIENIRIAKEDNDTDTLNFYKVMRVEYPTKIVRSYPVKEEVLAVVRNNPNLVQTIKDEFDRTALLNTRIDEYDKLVEELNAAYDDYTRQQIQTKIDALLDERITNIQESIEAEIETQRAERVSYLESLLGTTTE